MDHDPGAVDDYIAAQPPAVAAELQVLREQILAVVPEATEHISYGMPTFSLEGRYLVYLAAWKRHLSLYPVPHGDAALEQELAPYRSGSGTLQFPLGQPIPEGLVGRIVAALKAARSADR
jgi:uncharacterized protein YdhG (YjbR/CyaY superfamily)